ncbi:polyketide-type polyunsaturated fatty acid synthase PfaA [Gracilaria domingensis]|nr:polyketide-type polyunsaturated fatty acid synthase PfaA [Gracilaria domingensis]
MYGAYVNSSCVRARDVLCTAAEIQSVSEALRRDGLHALMWNLTALDFSTGAPNMRWEHRLEHNLSRAGTEAQVIYQAPLSTMIASMDASFHTQLEAARQDARRLLRRRGVTYVTRLSGRQILAWVYIALSVVISCVCAGKNWPRRDNAFERAKDAVDVATLLLVSVFGLVKLTSEDPNALKSLARGRAPVEDLEQAGRFLRVGALLRRGRGCVAMEGMQRLLGVDMHGVEWARAQGCCYGRAVQGAGLDTMAAKLETLKKGGFFFLEGVCKRPHFWNTCVKVEAVTSEVATFGDTSEKECDLDFSRAALYTKVA